MACSSCNKGIVQTVVNGAVGLTKATLRIDRASDEEINQRRDICRECPYAQKWPKFLNHICKGLTDTSTCSQCHCIISEKTKVASEECPLKKWLAVNK